MGYVGVDERLAIVFSAADQIRHTAVEGLKELQVFHNRKPWLFEFIINEKNLILLLKMVSIQWQKLGLQLFMLTGDSASAAEIIQRQVHLQFHVPNECWFP